MLLPPQANLVAVGDEVRQVAGHLGRHSRLTQAHRQTGGRNAMNALAGVVDMNGDGLPVLCAREASTKKLWLSPGRSAARRTTDVRPGTGLTRNP
jgi:hypothetical protein